MATTNKNFKVKNGLDVNGPIGVGSTPSYGSTGQVLTSQGTGSAPTWTTVSSDGLTASDYVSVGILSSDQTVTSGSDTLISFVDFADPQNWWDASTKRFQPTIAGYYNITLQVWWTYGVVTSQTNLQIRKNGNSHAILQTLIQTDNDSGVSLGSSRIIYLNGTTDYVDFTAYTGNTTSQVIQKGTTDGSGTYFSAALMTAGKGDKGDTGDTGPAGTSPNAFTTVSANGTSVVADSSTDTLTITPGSGMSIVGNATSDTVTFSVDYAEKIYYLVRNNTGSTIPKGTLVSASGAEPSGRIDVAPHSTTGTQDSELRVMGMVTANISNGVNGEVISFGTLVGIDTRGDTASAIAVGDETWAEGDILYAHPTVAGKLTNVRPQHDLAVAFITVRHASTGQIAVRIIPGNNHLEWLHDVAIDGTPADNELLAYNSASSLWINQTAEEAGVANLSGATFTGNVAGTNISVTGNVNATTFNGNLSATQISVSATASFNKGQGSAPFTVASTTEVTNLTAQFANTAFSVAISNVTSMGTNVSTFLTTPNSINFLNTITDETGTGNVVFSTSPVLTTPNIGAAIGTSVNVTGQLISTVATGTAPLAVTSTTKVTNLNADLLDGYNTSTNADANTVSVRDTNGSIKANVFYGDVLGSSITVGDNISANTINTTSLANVAQLTVGSTATFNKPEGSAPFIVVSTTQVTNLTAQFVTNGVYTTTTSLPNVTSVNSTTIPNSATLLTTGNIGSTVQAYDNDIASLANTINAVGFLYNNGAGTFSYTSIPNDATTAASANGASTIVARDANGSFAGNVITATKFIGIIDGGSA